MLSSSQWCLKMVWTNLNDSYFSLANVFGHVVYIQTHDKHDRQPQGYGCQRLLLLNLHLLRLMHMPYQLGLRDLLRLQILKTFGFVAPELPRAILLNRGSHAHLIIPNATDMCVHIFYIHNFREKSKSLKKNYKRNQNFAVMSLFWILEIEMLNTSF